MRKLQHGQEKKSPNFSPFSSVKKTCNAIIKIPSQTYNLKLNFSLKGQDLKDECGLNRRRKRKEEMFSHDASS